MPFKAAPRLRAFDYCGPYRYFLTICTRDRRSLFVSASLVDVLVVQFQQASDLTGMAVLAYCFMPDHVHALVEGASSSANFREFVRLFKQLSSFAYTRVHARPLWQRSYFERVLRADEDSVRVARYILENPVRAGLVTDAMQYPFSGSLTLEMKDLVASMDLDCP
jgi:putative transposase